MFAYQFAWTAPSPLDCRISSVTSSFPTLYCPALHSRTNQPRLCPLAHVLVIGPTVSSIVRYHLLTPDPSQAMLTIASDPGTVSGYYRRT